MTKRELKVGRGNQPVIFYDLMAAVGSFLFYWGQLEQNLYSEIERLKLEAGEGEGPLRGTFQERLDNWEKLVAQTGSAADIKFAKQLAGEVEDLRMDRNIIAHGLVAGDAQPKIGDPYIECREGGYDNPNGRTRRYILTELEELTGKADRCRLRFLQAIARWHCQSNLG